MLIPGRQVKTEIQKGGTVCGNTKKQGVPEIHLAGEPG